MTPRSPIRLAAALFLAGAPSAQATLFQGPPGGKGDVLVFAAPGTAHTRPPELQGIVLLPVDATGRSDFTRFQPDQPRLESDVPLAARLVLPHGHGSLYRYRRERGGGADFGYFVVRANGLASFLAAFAGTGPTGSDDPIPSPVAVSSDGDALLVATGAAAGGDLFEIEVESGTVHALTTGLPPLDVLPQGLAVLPRWGVALTSRGPLRFLRGGGTPVSVALNARSAAGSIGHNPPRPRPPALTYFGNGIARSADGSTVAVIAGTSASQAHVFTFGAAGPSVCVNDGAAPIADPGFGTDAGPTLALSPDGRRAAWKTFPGSGECFSREVPLLPTPTETHVTGDLHFADTLNDTGVIAFFDPDSVVLLVGEANGAGGVEKADLYRARFPLGGGAPVFTNLTGTSGDMQAPFLEKGDLETTDGIYQIPGDQGVVCFVPGSSGQGRILRLDATNASVDVLRTGVEALDFVEHAGASFVLGIVHEGTLQKELVQVPFDHTLPAPSLGFFAPAEGMAHRAGNAAGTFAGILNVTGGQILGQLFLPTGAGSRFSDTPAVYGSMLGFDGRGAVLASVHTAQGSYFLSWPASGATELYQPGPGTGHVLPAN
jgi:hypothetical protein